MTTRDLILRALTAPKQRGVHYAADSAAQLLAEYDAERVGYSPDRMRVAVAIARENLAAYDAERDAGLTDMDRAGHLGACSESLRILLRAVTNAEGGEPR